ncbi:MAG: DNA gyrase inhibitor YacG [Vicinamibacterales bacterium]
MNRMGEARVCVLCERRPVDERWRPFCSERCRTEDLARWAEGRYRVAGDDVLPPVPDKDADNDL